MSKDMAPTAAELFQAETETYATVDAPRYCAEPCCIARPAQRITTRIDGTAYSKRYDDDYCTKHAAAAVAALGGGGISLVVSIAALPPIVPVPRVNAGDIGLTCRLRYEELGNLCEWGRGPDPVSGCDSLADGSDGLCSKHRAAYAALSAIPED